MPSFGRSKQASSCHVKVAIDVWQTSRMTSPKANGCAPFNSHLEVQWRGTFLLIFSWPIRIGYQLVSRQSSPS